MPALGRAAVSAAKVEVAVASEASEGSVSAMGCQDTHAHTDRGGTR